MRLWRITSKAHAAAPLDGRGGLVVSGRWHPRGIRIVYASGTLSLAALETLVHVDPDLAPRDLVQVRLEVPDGLVVESVGVEALPRGWRRHPAPVALQRRGLVWIEAARSAVLRVPSAVIPEEPNYLINPVHPDAGRIAVSEVRDFALDPRLVS